MLQLGTERVDVEPLLTCLQLIIRWILCSCLFRIERSIVNAVVEAAQRVTK